MSEKQALLIGLLIIIVFQIANLQLAHLIFQKLFNIKTKTLNLMLFKISLLTEAEAAIVVFDTTKEETFGTLKRWIKELHE